MNYNKVEFGTLVLIDLTSDTVAESDVARGKTFHNKAGSKLTGTVTVIEKGSTYTASASIISASNNKLIVKMPERLFRSGAQLELSAGSYLGTAPANNIPSTETFSSSNGIKVTGTMDTTKSRQDKTIAADYVLSKPGGKIVMSKYINGNKRFAMMGYNNLYMESDGSNFGDATAEDVRSGKTFTSASGVKVKGTAVF